MPDNAESGDVYIVTDRNLESNHKIYTVNDKPLGAGLCFVYTLIAGTASNNGQPGDKVFAAGVRFGESNYVTTGATVEEVSKVIFNQNKPVAFAAQDDSWSDILIKTTVPTDAVAGEVIVTKKVEIGSRCKGFHISSWCPSGQYEATYEEVPSNPVFFNISNACASHYIGQWDALETGFRPPNAPPQTYTIINGNRAEYTQIDMGLVATDGKYLYTTPYIDAIFGSSGSNSMDRFSIYKIGTGEQGTELGRVYHKYIYEYTKNQPAWFGQTNKNPIGPTGILNATGWGPGFSGLAMVDDGSLYLSWLYHTLQRPWETDYVLKNKEYWGKPRVIWPSAAMCPDNQFECQYGVQYKEIPQEVIPRYDADFKNHVGTGLYTWFALASNGSNIYAIAYDLPGGNTSDLAGFTIQVFDRNWKELKKITVNNANYPSSGVGNVYTAVNPENLIADKEYLYYTRMGTGYYQVAIDLQRGEWHSAWPTCMSWTNAVGGCYDWVNNKIWMTPRGNDSSSLGLYTGSSAWYNTCQSFTPGKHNRIYRYDTCMVSQVGLCRTDQDCTKGILACQSKCINGGCTPDIKTFDPNAGPIGTWVTLTGCHFGCEPGQVYFRGGLGEELPPTLQAGSLARYRFNTDNSAADQTNQNNGTIVSGATVSNGAANFDGTGYIDLATTTLNNVSAYGDALTGKMTLVAWIKPTSYIQTGTAGYATIAKRMAGFHYLALHPTLNGLVLMTLTKTGNIHIFSNSKIPLNQWTHIALVLEAGKSYKIYINGVLDKVVNSPDLLLSSYAGAPAIGYKLDGGYSNFQGQIDDFFVYNRVLTEEEITMFSFSKKALPVSDSVACCTGSWQCSPSGYDQAIVEVPNKNILPNEENTDLNDAIDGSIKLITANGLIATTANLTPPIFDVNNETVGPQICALNPNYGNRGITVNICGKDFGPSPAQDDYINFEPLQTPGQLIGEPFFDEDNDYLYDYKDVVYAGEKFIDFIEEGVYNPDLLASAFTFQIQNYVNKLVKDTCPGSDGWSENNICFNVPAAAGGTGTADGKAMDNVSVHKIFNNEDKSGNDKEFLVTFGACGNEQIDRGLGEMCDGTYLPSITTDQMNTLCQDLFPPEDYPPSQYNLTCSVQCDVNCGLLVCINNGNLCKSIKQLCGIDGIDEVKDIDGNIIYDEECDNNVEGDHMPNPLPYTCDDFELPPTCDIGCNDSCKLIVCDENGLNCQTMDDLLCGNGDIDHLTNSYEQCDTDNLDDESCQSLISGSTGVLACYPEDTNYQCHFDASGCQTEIIPPVVIGPQVTDTDPEHNETQFCRNGIAEISFSDQLAAGTISNDTIKLEACSGLMAQNTKKNILARVYSNIKTIVVKLFGLENKVLAQPDCTQVDYSIENSTVYSKSKLSIVPTDLLLPGQEYRMTVLGGDNGVKNDQDAILDNSNTPITDPQSYVFYFKTLGTPDDLQSGICDAEWIDVIVYRQAYTTPDLADRPAEFRNDDLFICAGRDNCHLQADYDQDPAVAGNQHIYEAVAKYSDKNGSGSFTLNATYKWSKTDESDPQRAVTIFNNQTDGDSEPDNYKVKNESGITYITPAPIKEAVAKLAVEAQAIGSTASPAQNQFMVYILLCENPWPSLSEKFPISSIINAYNFQTYYCRDAGKQGDTSDDLPAARWLSPETTNLNVLNNLDFEFGNLNNWLYYTGQAFNFQPVFTDITKKRTNVSANIQGSWWIGTFEKYRGNYWEQISNVQGDTPVGVISSQAFLIEGDELRFRIGGSFNHWPAGLHDVVTLEDDRIANVTAVILGIKEQNDTTFLVVNEMSGENKETMRETFFEVSIYKEKIGIIYIYDNNVGGHINFDDLRQYLQGRQIPIKY